MLNVEVKLEEPKQEVEEVKNLLLNQKLQWVCQGLLK